MSALIVVGPNGDLRFVHDDDLAPIASAVGDVLIRRASTVEPDDSGQWVADLAPVGGPTVGPFGRRSTALKAERDWIEGHGIPEPLGGGR